jgi:hypothetical protein
MVAPEVQGIDLFKIAGRSISGWIPSLKTGSTVRQPFCSQIEERLRRWLEFTKCCVIASTESTRSTQRETCRQWLPVGSHLMELGVTV